MSAAAELRRLRYLAALGVTPLVSRAPLPGAAPSRKLALRERGPSPGAPQASRRPPAPRATAPRARGETAGPRATRFRLAVIVCARRLWLEDLGNGALATEQLQLVAAIARALEHGAGETAEPVVTQFDWPLHGNRQLDLGAGEAAVALSSFLERRLDEQSCVELMCLGQAAAERVAPLALSCPVRRLPATRALLSVPLRKRELWRELRPR